VRLLLVLLVTGLLHAEEAPTESKIPVKGITFMDALDLGLAHNLGLESERLNAIVARLKVQEEAAAWDTIFDASVGGGEENLPARSQLAGANIVDTDNLNFSLGLQQPLRTGGTFGIALRTDRTFSNSSFATINPAYDTAFEFTLTLPLLRGWGRTVNEAELRAAHYNSESARFALVTEVADVVTAVGNAYWTLAFEQSQVKVLQKSFEVASEIEEDERKKARPEVGRSTRLDVTRAVAETQRRLAALIDGKRRAGDAADDLRELVLPFTGDPETDALVFMAIDVPEEAGVGFGLDDAIAEAFLRRPEMRRADADLKAQGENVVLARDATRPELTLSGTAASRGVASTFPTSADQTFGGDAFSADARLDLSYPFGLRAARAALRQAELQLQRVRLDRAQLMNTVVGEVRRAHRAVLAALDEIEARKKEASAAGDALDGERKRLARGSSTVINVTILEEDKTRAEIRLLEGYLNLERARIEFLRVTGTLLERYRITMDGRLQASRKQPKPAPVE
jgi:outer membrane protein TolC